MDDINMPEKDDVDSQPAVELLRQLLDHQARVFILLSRIVSRRYTRNDILPDQNTNFEKTQAKYQKNSKTANSCELICQKSVQKALT